MSCQCYQIGGPFISFDPDCPAHGLDAQAREREEEVERQEAQAREEALLSRVEELEKLVEQLRTELAQREQRNT